MLKYLSFFVAFGGFGSGSGEATKNAATDARDQAARGKIHDTGGLDRSVPATVRPAGSVPADLADPALQGFTAFASGKGRSLRHCPPSGAAIG
jgi:hypothetical protein